MKISKVEVEVPAGSYVLGDPCYSFPDYDEWMELLESCKYFNDPIGTIRRSPKEGTFNVMETFNVVAFSTRWGDGRYRGTDGNSYAVDAGLIGLVPVEALRSDADSWRDDLCTVVTFDKPTKCGTDGEGKLRFGHITIDTDPTDDDEEDEDEDEAEAQRIDDASWRA